MFYHTFNLLMARSLGFGFNKNNFIHFKICFHYAYIIIKLSLLFLLSHWLIMQKVHCYFIIISFNCLSTFGFSYYIIEINITFPLRYFTLSVIKKYLGLEDGPPIFKQDYTCPALLKNNIKHYPYGTITLYG